MLALQILAETTALAAVVAKEAVAALQLNILPIS
jgi:hypothetical protein